MNEVHALFEFFQNHLQLKSIAEELRVFTPENFREKMSELNFQTGVIQTETGLLKFDINDEKPTPILLDEIFSPEMPLFEAFPYIAQNRRIFIGTSKVSHIATRSDLDKIPVRLGLFGLISVLESILRNIVSSRIPAWEESLSKERLEAAHKLYQMKIARSEEIDLIQCLQFGDLGSIFSKSQRFKRFGDALSRKVYDDRMRNIGKLRDALAHSQNILPFDWMEISEMIEFINYILSSIPNPSPISK